MFSNCKKIQVRWRIIARGGCTERDVLEGYIQRFVDQKMCYDSTPEAAKFPMMHISQFAVYHKMKTPLRRAPHWDLSAVRISGPPADGLAGSPVTETVMIPQQHHPIHTPACTTIGMFFHVFTLLWM